jgi:hypothetical protein
LHGYDKLAPALMKILNLDCDGGYDTGRFRDIHLNADGTKIILLTRNGGGNREDYQGVIDHLATHPNYLSDYDDDFDCTYAYVEFSTPQEYLEQCKGLTTGEKLESIYDKFQKVIEQIKNSPVENHE